MWNNNTTITENQYVDILNSAYAIYEEKGIAIPCGYSEKRGSLDKSDYEKLDSIIEQYSLPFYSFSGFMAHGQIEISEEINNLKDFENFLAACRTRKGYDKITIVFKTKEAFKSFFDARELVEKAIDDLDINIETKW